MSLLDREGIAERIRSLIANEPDPFRAAELLGVQPGELKTSIDPILPFQSSAVLEAIVREYGVDPTWLITGDYDVRTHVQSVDDGPGIVKAIVNDRLLHRENRDQDPRRRSGEY
jgi:hypothetical protein